MPTQYIKQGDTAPSLRALLYSSGGAPANLTGATVKFTMGLTQGAPLVDAAAVIVDAPGGVVEYVWVAGDTNTAGTFLAEFQVTYASGKIETFPNGDYITVLIKGDVN